MSQKRSLAPGGQCPEQARFVGGRGHVAAYIADSTSIRHYRWMPGWQSINCAVVLRLGPGGSCLKGSELTAKNDPVPAGDRIIPINNQ